MMPVADTQARAIVVKVPGTNGALEYEREPNGRLLRLSGGGRTYLEERDGARIFEGGWLRISEGSNDHGFLRFVEAPYSSWIEEYRWDGDGYPVHIDGVDIRRDADHRVIGCRGQGVEWGYGYSANHLTVIDSPVGTRYITRGDEGRPIRLRQGGQVENLAYGKDGLRLGIESVPANWNCDSLGRLWTICDSHNRVLNTFLWDGFGCIACIDGPPGAPLAAIFSLDPSRTPVRIISPERVLAVPRDLYGESLVGISGVPGLHGGAMHRGFVHLRSRVLDPRCGSYDRPDPFHGRDDDPRRKNGFRGPLSVESAVTGPYAVCQYDGITFTDPTGESTGLLVLSDFTWSFVHNIAGWFGLDWTLNFWLSLFSGRPGEFFEFESFHSDRTHAYGTRRGGVIADIFGTQARTYHHQIWVQAEGFDELSDGYVFDPGGVFEPVLYGTLLRGEPQKGTFLLQGNLDTIPTLGAGSVFSPPPWPWGRAGGTAKAVVPGLPVPRFPSGGLHFTSPLRGVRGLQDCKMTELVPVSMPPVTATVSQSSLLINVASIPAGLAVNDEVMLSDAGGVADIKTVTSLTRPDASPGIRFADTQQTVAGNGIELRGLSGPSAPDTLTPGGPVNGLLTDSSTLPFVAGDPLRLSQANVVAGAAIINRLETRLNIDGALPAAIKGDIDVRSAILSGTSATVSLTGNALTGSPLPQPGDFISLDGGGITIGALVGGTTAAPTVDRDAVDLTPLGASVNWRLLTQSSSIGKATDRDGTATTFTYAPLAPRTAPTTGFLILLGPVNTARFVKSAVYDAIALNTKLPADPTKKFQVERFTFEAPDLTNLTIDTLQGLVLPNDTPLPGVALQLNILGGPKVVAGAAISPANLAAGVATFPLQPPPAIGPIVGPTPVPSQLVVLTDAANNIETAVVSVIKVKVRFDRSVPAQLPDIRLVALGPGGPAYSASMNADGTLTASAIVGATAVQMPRFNVGEIVEVAGGGLLPPRLFSVTVVSGCTLTLVGDTAIGGAPAGLTVQRMVPISAPGPAIPLTSPFDAANNGTPWAGVKGELVAGVATDAAFQMWRPDDATRIQQCCMVSSDPANPATPSVVIPLRLLNVLDVSITFTSPPAKVSGTITITDPNPIVFYAASFAQSAVDLTIAGVLPSAIPPSNNLIIAVPYAPGSPLVSASGTLGPGTVLCPDDPVNWEFDRRHSLAEHELTHSLQPARHGQIYWGIWPLFVYEGVMEALSDVELPKFSAYVSGKIEKVNATRVLRIPDPQGVTFKTGTRVQVSNDSQAQDSVTLGAPATGAGGGFIIDSNFSIRDGDVKFRAQVDSAAGTTIFRDIFYNIFRLTSLGGLMNVAGAAVYGGLVYGIGGLINGVRMIFASNTTYPAKVDDDGLTVHMTDDAGKAAMQGVSEIVIHFGDKTDSRELASIADDTLKLKKTTELHGAVQVAVKNKFGDIWDWHTYYTASVPDAATPARIKIQPRDGGDTLTLKQFDRVTIGAGTSFSRSNVTAVTAEGLVDLEDAPPASSRSGFRIALVDSNDPIRGIDDRILTEMGPGKVKLGWLRIAYDPFEQINFRFEREKNSVWDIVARVARYGWGTHTWSWAIPGTLFLMNLFIQAKKNSLGEAQGHLSPFEQEASSNSGNLYSPLGRLFGGFSSSGFGTYNAVAGDVARYWHTLFQGVTNTSANNEWLPSTAISAFNRDSPGVNMQKLLRVVPNFTGTPGSPEPNGTIAPANLGVAGTFVPDLLVTKNFATPAATAAVGPTGLAPSDLGLIPTTPRLNQSIGCYLAFTQPGTHRITIQDVTSNAQIGRQGREAQAGSSQTLWFDITVSDVGLKVAGQDVAAVPPSPISLVVLQQAGVSVTPEDAGQQYALTVARPGAVVTPAPKQLAAGTAVGNDVVEVSRVYTFTPGATPGTGSFDAPVLNEHNGMHLPATFHVPVRTFPVTVVNTVPMLDASEPIPTSNVVTSRLIGEHGFLLVPVNVTNGVTMAFSYASPSPGIRDPNLGIPAQPTPSDAAREFLGSDGHIFDFTFGDPPEEPLKLTITMTVTAGGVNATVTCGPIDYNPDFRLIDSSGKYQVKLGKTLDLTAENNVAIGTVTLSPQGLTAAVTGSALTLTCDPAAPLGFHTVLCDVQGVPARLSRRTIEVIA